MHKLDLIIAYILAFITIYFLQTLYYPSDWCLPVCIVFLLLYPITLPFIQKHTSGQIKEFSQIFLDKISNKYPITSVYYIVLCISLISSTFYNFDKGIYFVAIVKTPEKAGEIQTLLTKQHRSTGRRVIVDKKDGNIKYAITLSRYETDENQYKEAIAELVNSNIMDNSVEIP